MVFTSPAWSTSRGKVSWSDNAQTGVSRQTGIRNWKHLLLAEGHHQIGKIRKKQNETFHASNLTMSLQNVNPCEFFFFLFGFWLRPLLALLGRGGESGRPDGPDGGLQRTYALRKGTCINDVMYLYKDITLTCNDSSFFFSLLFGCFICSHGTLGARLPEWFDHVNEPFVWKDVVCCRVDSSGN